MFNQAWRKFRMHLFPKDFKDQERVNRKLCDQIEYLQKEFVILARKMKRLEDLGAVPKFPEDEDLEKIPGIKKEDHDGLPVRGTEAGDTEPA